MKKRLIVLTMSVICVIGLTACRADDLNDTINSAASKAGLNSTVNISQDDLDKLGDTAKNVAKDTVDTAVDVVTDEKVQDTVGDAAEAITDAVKNSLKDKLGKYFKPKEEE